MTITPDNNILRMNYPASWWNNLWREALPSGNGRIGAAVYGGVHQETILLNHSELWHGVHRAALPDVSNTLAEVRRLMDDRQYAAANTVLSQALQAHGYQVSVGTVLPFADFKLTMPCQQGFKHYNRSLNMAIGEVTVQWQDGTTTFVRRLFVSRADDVVVYDVQTSHAPIHGQIEITLHDFEDPRHVQEDDVVMKNPVSRAELLKTLDVQAEREYLFYAVQNDDDADFGAVARVIATGGAINTSGSVISIQAAQRLLILTKLFVKGERQTNWQALKQELDEIAPDYQTLCAAHRPLHQGLFESAAIILAEGEPDRSNEELLLEAYTGEPSHSLIQKMWAYGRYLFISATRQDDLPCALYGLWCGDYNPIWCQNVANENIEMMYWHAAVGGLFELMRSLFNYYGSLLADSRENARKLFGCRGMVIHSYTSPGMGLANVNVPVILNWTGAAGWIGKFYFDCYQYTGDQEFLVQTALPFMREVALFYEDFWVVGEDGYWKFYPSVSPENSPGNYVYDALSHPLPTTINATMDFAIAKELLTNLLEGCRIAGVYAAETAKWEVMLRSIPPYQINQDGAVREWMHPDFDDNYNHRHIAHIYPVFPRQEIKPD